MYLSGQFLDKYIDRTPSWGAVGEITFLRTYSRDGERWWQTVERVVNGCYSWQRMHCMENGRPWSEKSACRSAEQMYDLMFNFKFLPPGRGLRNMGAEVVHTAGGGALNNCGFVSTKNDWADAASWAMDMLMLGVGIGFDTLGAGGDISSPDHCRSIPYIIPDSRAGWVDSVRVLLQSYQGRKTQKYVAFDYSKIRAAGEPIKGFGGIASGPKPLVELHQSLRKLFNKRIQACNDTLQFWVEDGELTSSDINDIMALIGRCVVSGGVRRSAEISIGDSNDLDFMELKNRTKFPDENNSYRWASNHSVACVPGATDYTAVLDATLGVDELGILWLDNAKRFSRMGGPADNLDEKARGCNPCGEQTLEHKELCCLVEVFPSRIQNVYEFQKVLKYAYLYAKTVTTIETHDPDTQEIINRNRRIGCSLTGIQGAIQQKGSSEFYRWCDEGYAYLRQLDNRYSEWLDVARSIKITSVKPSGTVSKLPGVSSGIHFPVSECYFQVIRFASTSPYLEPLRRAGHKCVDLSPDEPNTTAVYFGVIEDNFPRSESDVSMWEQAEHAAKLQHYWSDNQVSITVKYDPKDRDQIPYLLSMYEDRLKSISFFPNKGHSFSHAPWQPASRKEIQDYIDSLKAIDYSGGTEHELNDEFCSGETCLIPEG